MFKQCDTLRQGSHVAALVTDGRVFQAQETIGVEPRTSDRRSNEATLR
jgi:hypothetical protein